jgi:hypothetical protein
MGNIHLYSVVLDEDNWQCEWIELENITLSKVSQTQKAKAHMFSPYVENKCSNIIGYGSHTKGRLHKGGAVKGKET